jgi:hypothetical protein
MRDIRSGRILLIALFAGAAGCGGEHAPKDAGPDSHAVTAQGAPPPQAAAASAGVATPLAPSIRVTDGGPVLELTPAMQRALREQAPLFVTWGWSEYSARIRDAYRPSPREGVFAVVADFNGDSIPDVALDGHEGDTPRVIAVLSNGVQYRVVGVTYGTLDADDAIDGVRQTHLRIVMPGGIYERLTATAIAMPRYDARGKRMYPEYVTFWQGDRFVQYVEGE